MMMVNFRDYPFRHSIVVAVTCLAGASLAQAAWTPLIKEIINNSSDIWTIDFSAQPTARLGYFIGHGTAGSGSGSGPGAVAECKGTAVLRPGEILGFYVDEIGPGRRQGCDLRFRIWDNAAPKGELVGVLNVEMPGTNSSFSEEPDGAARGPRPPVVVASTMISINNPGAPAPGHAETKTETKLDGKGSLPNLSDEDREAGATRPEGSYTVGRIRRRDDWGEWPNWATALHQDGNRMSSASLYEIFVNTIFQYYTRKLVGYDANLNYDQYPTLPRENYDGNYTKWLGLFCHPRGVNLFPIPAPGSDFSQFKKYQAALEMARRSLENNSSFRRLAVAYMREKIICEKLIEAGSIQRNKTGSSKEINRLSSNSSLLCNTLQIMLYNWMDQAYAQFVNKYQHTSDPESGAPLYVFYPAFLSEPFYSKIMERMPVYERPVTEVEGIPLPLVQRW
ncbi:MAG: hypothetical protein P4L36_04330 [Holophaga sp.]|nr:hypothetical protein [Holophaga sp.]